MKILFVAILFIAYDVVGQAPDSIMSIKGKWSVRSGGNSKKIDSIAAVFRQAYPEPRGGDPYWYASLDEGSLYPGSPSSYAYRSALMFYYYNSAQKKIVKTGETGTWAYAFVNRLFWFCDETQMSITADGQRRAVWVFPHEKGTWKGYTLYEPVTHGELSSAIMITKNNKLPYKPVSKLQYLTELRKIREAEKKAAANSIGNSNSFWDKELKTIDDYISNNTPATLAQQAIVTNWRIFNGSFPKLTAKNAYKLVYLDYSYFNNKLPANAAQFMVVYWRWNKNAPGLYFRQQLEQNLQVEKLKAMIQD